MRKQVVTYQDDEYDVLITVRAARVKDGIRRSLIINEQLGTNLGEEVDRLAAVAKKVEEEKKKKEEETPTVTVPPLGPGELGIRLLRMYTYPACVCSVDKVENLDPKKEQLSADISVEDFLELPDALVFIWEEAAYELNPHWVPRLTPRTPKEEEKAKKASETPKGSSIEG